MFHDHGGHVLDPFLKPGFRHCFVAVESGEYWIRIDAQGGRPVIEVIAASDYDLAAFYREEGYTVIETQQQAGGACLFVAANCVGLVKTVLGLRASFVVTPWQLCCRVRSLGETAVFTTSHKKTVREFSLPGFGFFQPPKPNFSSLKPTSFTDLLFPQPFKAGELLDKGKKDTGKVRKKAPEPPKKPSDIKRAASLGGSLLKD